MKKTNLSSKKAKNEEFPFMSNFNGRFKELFFLKFFNLPEILAINQNSFLKNKIKKFCRFTQKKAVRLKKLRISKLLNLPSKIDKNENFWFLEKTSGRFRILKKIKKINLPAKNAENINSFLISSFKKFLRFSSENPRRFYFLNLSKLFNLSAKNGINQNFSFTAKSDGRFENIYFLKKNNLRYFSGKNRRFYFNLNTGELFIFLLKNAGRLKCFEFLESGNLRAKTTVNWKFCFMFENGGRL